MIHDATVEVTCDRDGCGENVYVNPPFIYRTMSAASGYYDTSDSRIQKLLGGEGWTVVDGKTFCETHSQ